MNTDDSIRIPVIVGVTGHRAIRKQDEAVLKQTVETELRKLQAKVPDTPVIMLNSLAEGADLLCAETAEKLGIPLMAALPRSAEDYMRDFSEAGKERFARQCSRAMQVFTVPYTEDFPENGSLRNFGFRQAGIYVVSRCHVLLALWDGSEPEKGGCGTAEAVDFALNGSYDPSSGIAIRSVKNTAVIHIVTPRDASVSEPAGTVHYSDSRENVLDILKKTDIFNRNSQKLPKEPALTLPFDTTGDPYLERMLRVRNNAGRLSRDFAKRYRQTLGILAVTSSLLAFSFLMYDNLEIFWMILACGIVLLCAWVSQRYASRSDCHRQYIEYRALAEYLRVQSYLRYAGSSIQVADLLNWTQREETAWVMISLLALSVGDPPSEKHDISICWILSQQEYHRQAGRSAGRKLDFSENTVRIAMTVSILIYLIAIGFEIICGGLFFRPSVSAADADFWRTALKVVLGTISVGTLFTANYYGRLSLPRVLSDHRKMERFFSRMSDELENRGQTEMLLTMLAREELTENGNWVSYQRDNKPDISI